MRRPGQRQQASAIRRLNSRAWLVAIVLLLFHAPVTDFLGRVAEAADLHVAIGGIASPGSQITGGGNVERGSGHQAAPRVPASAARAVASARQQIGKPYVWGDEGPGRFDCSGLAWYAWSHAGLDWPRMTARDQYRWLAARGAGLPRNATLQPGDLVFYDTDRPFGHVAIISAPGRMVEAYTHRRPIRQTTIRRDYIAAARPGQAR
jgi:cell wall-associated NlpC family hydrolase